MKTPLFSRFFALLLPAIDSRLSAQILDIGQYKGTVYEQTSPSPAVTPRYPDVYYFANLLDADPTKALEYSPFMVFTALHLAHQRRIRHDRNQLVHLQL